METFTVAHCPTRDLLRRLGLFKVYHMEGKVCGGKIWRIDSFRAFGEKKFGELIDQPIDYQL